MSEIKSQSNQLENAIKNNDVKKQAEIYISIADTYFNQSNFSKSEENLNKAKNIYEKTKDKNGLATVSRKLAQTQESQNKTKSAAANYEKAASFSKSKKQEITNRNDYSRVASKSLEAKEKAVQGNIILNDESSNSDELAKDYSNLAEINVQQKNIPKAAENLNNAYEISKTSQPSQAIVINQKMTDLYVDNKNFDKAIEVKKQVLKEDFVKGNSEENVNQIQELADIYLQKNDVNEAIKLFKNAYQISLEKGHTLEAQKSVEKLDSLYQSAGNTTESMLLYRDFLAKLPNLVQNDRGLVDSKILEETENKIALLEKEKQLKDELIRKKNIFNYALIAALLLLSGLVFFIFKTLKKVQIKNKKIALQSLRREMNPHFIFNSLNSVNQFIATNNELEANQYLTKFSKLMRGVMENSTEDFIPFSQELDLLTNYLSLEKTRFTDKFEFEITVNENLNQQNLLIPGMKIQPFLENAIWHGLRYRTEKGFLKLNFEKEIDTLKITIEDNGIGIEESKKQKTEHQKNREGRGMKNTLERIKLLNDLYKRNIICEVKDSENGVLVELKMNLE
ncbi:histidine kinase [Frigoriflavimonas asaccharolytica]|uniref:Tetratricopeptide (TPR) repeat protein n=1 Tax=Frigoriflavimonas asaccharolytica TaxID=2735899 RepID=A0A8J8K8K9_9FLAO|nr:histidine kinase [Frigoriflavimonas asaccharolytica]NRS92072.1 tetratricopeptide (TPR) repeat protein [Frigoriflavimonas asaccharolytica]